MNVTVRALPLLSWLGAKTAGRGFGSGAEAVVVAPPSVRRLEPALRLEDEFDRVRSHTEHDTMEHQLRCATAEIDETGPTRLLELRDVLVNAQGAFSVLGAARTSSERRRLLQRGPIEEVEEAVFCSDWFIQKFFGHWLRDGLAREVLAADLGLPSLAVRPSPWLHEAGYRAALKLQLSHEGPSFVRRLTVVDDYNFNASRIDRAQRMRQAFQAGAASADCDRVVYVARGRIANGRTLVNEAEVIAALGLAAEDVLHPETSTVEHIRDVLSRARLVVLVEGSAQMHAFLGLRAGSGVLTIQPPERFNATARIYFSGVDIVYGYSVADPCEGGFRAPIDRLLRLRDLMLRRIEGGGALR